MKKTFTRTAYDDHLRKTDEQAFLDSAVLTLRDASLNEIMERCHLAKFEQFKYKNDKLIDKDIRNEATSLAESRRLLRESFLNKTHAKKDIFMQSMKTMNDNWLQTQKVKRERVTRDLQFEMTLNKMRELKTLRRKQELIQEEESGINELEKNLKRLGIGGDSGGSSSVPMTVSYEASDLFERRIINTFNEQKPSDEEINNFVTQLKERTNEKKAARYEKARRRRRALADQALLLANETNS